MDKASVFHSARLPYRGITVLDAKAIVRWRSDPGNYRNFFNAHAVDAEEHMAWYEQYVRDSSRFDFVIVDPEGASIGTVTLSSICERSCELSYMIGEVSARGNGYAVEAVGAMTSIAFEELGVDEVYRCTLLRGGGMKRPSVCIGARGMCLILRCEMRLDR